MNKFLLALMLVAATAVAQPPIRVEVTPDPDFSYLHDAGKAEAARAGEQLGSAIRSALNPTITAVVATRQCGKLTSVTITYSNGKYDYTAIPGDATEAQLTQLTGALVARNAKFVDMACQ